MNEKITAYDAEILALEQLKINADEPLRASFSKTQEKLRVAKSTAVENRERKKAGRKPLPESEARRNRLSIRFTDEELALLRRRAKENGEELAPMIARLAVVGLAVDI